MTAKNKNSISTPLIIIGGTILIFLLFIMDPSSSTETKKYKNKDKIEALASKELKVLDAVVTEEGVLYIQVMDDGTSRNGYAEYLCQQLKDNSLRVKKIKVVIAGSYKWKRSKRDNAYGKIIGECQCN